MELIGVVAAAAAAWVSGAIWYMLWSKPWAKDAGLALDEHGDPKGHGSAAPFVISAIAMLVVAGMMRHIFGMGEIETPIKGALSGLGIGLFFIAPWILINNTYAMRPLRLTLIDGGYAAIACTLMGVVLCLF
ncbi:DUF1761 domain-containing protein [Rhodalgimonas zhirmunskyi]|uniref:DUF1761 domain-containing protein n=1 Tax=Rhodalgimonas zhirmunskyi TaxID=2964767 RepID=A0AAJ1U672_9RHOB|nr:DUF1761 domain-containing protein [Rhodoalgimonas zhirmunskyi]MDQ2094345.1 DUF1761 domain-containing protein [Rhodoalgimonas zhirmunskyi]